MKLIYCEKCGDMFKLGMKMKSCDCGAIKGRYKDNLTAEVSKEAVSVAIGNGSFDMARLNALQHFKDTGGKATREDYQMFGKIVYAWVRPNSGAGNPHTEEI